MVYLLHETLLIPNMQKLQISDPEHHTLHLIISPESLLQPYPILDFAHSAALWQI